MIMGNALCIEGILEQTDQRRRKEEEKKWVTKGNFETVLFVDAMPRSELAKECRKIMKEAEHKIRVVVRSGKARKRCLARSDPFQAPNCENEDCRVSKTDPALHCKTRDTCGETYIGKRAHSLGQRCDKHIKKVERNDAMLRLVMEAVYIHEENPGKNAKEEWFNLNIARRDSIRLTTGLYLIRLVNSLMRLPMGNKIFEKTMLR